jgi:hypothetical protein
LKWWTSIKYSRFERAAATTSSMKATAQGSIRFAIACEERDFGSVTDRASATSLNEPLPLTVAFITACTKPLAEKRRLARLKRLVALAVLQKP